MNVQDRSLEGPATLHFGDGEFVVLKPGRFVICAVSGKTIPLETLRYWSTARQEPYAGAMEASSRILSSSGGLSHPVSCEPDQG